MVPRILPTLAPTARLNGPQLPARRGFAVCSQCRDAMKRNLSPTHYRSELPQSGNRTRHSKSSQIDATQRRHFTLPDLGKLASSLASSGAGNGPDGKPKDVQRYEHHRTMPYTREELYALVSDIDSYKHFVPYCTRSQVIGPDPAYKGDPSGKQVLLADLGVGFGRFQEEYRSRVTLVKDVEVTAAALPESNPIFSYLLTRWSFSGPSTKSQSTSSARPISSAFAPAPPVRPAAASSPPTTAGKAATKTTIGFEIEFSFSNPVYSLVAGQVFEKTAGMVMQAFEQRAREVYGR